MATTPKEGLHLCLDERKQSYIKPKKSLLKRRATTKNRINTS